MTPDSIVGGCLCGAIRYSSSVAPVATAVCHCRDCQKQTGTSFSILLGIPRAGLRLAGDAPQCIETPGTSGLGVSRAFCGRCGSPIFSDARTTPELLWLKAGTLDDSASLQPDVHLWCGSAQPWLAIAEGPGRFARNPP
jgi:hypothetical protein